MQEDKEVKETVTTKKRVVMKAKRGKEIIEIVKSDDIRERKGVRDEMCKKRFVIKEKAGVIKRNRRK